MIAAVTAPHTEWVSVCIPSRNGARQLRRTLTNLLTHSTYPVDRLQVLVGDHGSTDDSAEVVNAFASRFPRVERVVVPFESPNRARVRNALIRRAEGRILVFLDNDVLASDDLVSSHVRAHQQYPAALVAGLTFGKGQVDADPAAICAGLDLEHISSSRAILAGTSDLADPRTRADLLASAGDVVAVDRRIAPFRHFWTCNLSARRSDIDECGGFDESYDGWGLEDDDFACQFRVHGKQLVFSHQAWGFHVPHPVDAWANLASWRKNHTYFLRKFRTREIEYYGLHGSELLSGARRLASIVSMVMSGDVSLCVERVAQALPSPRGRRVCHFIGDATLARRMGLTDALDPRLPLDATDQVREGVRFFPFLGVQTSFDDQEIDESLVLVAAFERLDRHLSTLLLAEAARFSRRVVFFECSARGSSTASDSTRVLREVASRIRFHDVVWV